MFTSLLGRQRGFAFVFPNPEVWRLGALLSAKLPFLQASHAVPPNPVADFYFGAGKQFSFVSALLDQRLGYVANMRIGKGEDSEIVTLTREQVIYARQTYPDYTGGAQILLRAEHSITYLKTTLDEIRTLRRS